MVLIAFSSMIDKPYPHFDWLDSQTVTLSVSESGRVRVCRIGSCGALPGNPLCLAAIIFWMIRWQFQTTSTPNKCV